LAKEAGLCYASLCVITNPAAGLSQNMVTVDEVKIGVEKAQKNVFAIISNLAHVLEARVSESSKGSAKSSSKTISGSSSERVAESSSKKIAEGSSKKIAGSSSKKISKSSSNSKNTAEKCRCKKAIDGGKL